MIELVQRVLNLERRMEATRKIDRSLGDVISPFLALPELRGFWPLSSVNETGNALDLSGQARTLTNTGATTRAVYNSLVNYFDFDGATQYLSRADEAGLDITDALTVGGWFWADALTASMQVIGKSSAGAANDAYRIRWRGDQAGDPIQFTVGDGVTQYTANQPASGTQTVTGAWYFVVGRYTPSTSVDLFVNNVNYTFTTAIPAALCNSAAAFAIGATGVPGNFFDGHAALCFLCADDLSSTLIDLLWQSSRGFFGV